MCLNRDILIFLLVVEKSQINCNISMPYLKLRLEAKGLCLLPNLLLDVVEIIEICNEQARLKPS